MFTQKSEGDIDSQIENDDEAARRLRQLDQELDTQYNEYMGRLRGKDAKKRCMEEDEFRRVQ